MKKLLVFLVLFLFYLGNTEAAEKKYLNVGADPIERDFCRKHKIETFSLPEDTFAATTARSHKVSVGWLRKGEQIGWVSKEKDEYIICACGNSVKFLDSPTLAPVPEELSSSIPESPEVTGGKVLITKKGEKRKESVKEETEEEVAEGVVTETTYYEPYYAREQKLPYFWHYEPSYGYGGYYSGGGYGYNSYRPPTYNYNTYTTAPPPPPSSPPPAVPTPRGGPGPNPPSHR